MAPMYWACSDVLTFASALASGAVPYRSATEMRAACQRVLHTMAERARAAGAPPEDVWEAQYALVALLDEILAVVPWDGKGEWFARPLQVLYFNENTAGEGFFHRAAALTQQPHRAHVLQVYFLSLAFGFQGRYAAVRGEGLAAVYDALGAALQPHVLPSEILAPHAVPPDVGRPPLRADAPIVRIALAVLGAALLLFAVLKWSAAASAAGARDRMMQHATGAGKGG